MTIITIHVSFDRGKTHNHRSRGDTPRKAQTIQLISAETRSSSTQFSAMR